MSSCIQASNSSPSPHAKSSPAARPVPSVQQLAQVQAHEFASPSPRPAMGASAGSSPQQSRPTRPSSSPNQVIQSGVKPSRSQARLCQAHPCRSFFPRTSPMHIVHTDGSIGCCFHHSSAFGIFSDLKDETVFLGIVSDSPILVRP